MSAAEHYKYIMNNLYRPGMVNLWQVEECPWRAAFTVVQIIFISFA